MLLEKQLRRGVLEWRERRNWSERLNQLCDEAEQVTIPFLKASGSLGVGRASSRASLKTDALLPVGLCKSNMPEESVSFRWWKLEGSAFSPFSEL